MSHTRVVCDPHTHSFDRCVDLSYICECVYVGHMCMFGSQTYATHLSKGCVCGSLCQKSVYVGRSVKRVCTWVALSKECVCGSLCHIHVRHLTDVFYMCVCVCVWVALSHTHTHTCTTYLSNFVHVHDRATHTHSFDRATHTHTLLTDVSYMFVCVCVCECVSMCVCVWVSVGVTCAEKINI